MLSIKNKKVSDWKALKLNLFIDNTIYLLANFHGKLILISDDKVFYYQDNNEALICEIKTKSRWSQTAICASYSKLFFYNYSHSIIEEIEISKDEEEEC